MGRDLFEDPFRPQRARNNVAPPLTQTIGHTHSPGPAQADFGEAMAVIGSERLTGALLDRRTHHVNILEMNGESYRLNQSRRRQTPTAN